MKKMIFDRLISKPWISFLIIVIALATIMPLTMRTAIADISGDYEYTINPDGVSVAITGYNGSGGNITIPDMIEGYPVTAIEINAFRYNTAIISVALSNNITCIGSQAFEKCTNLESVALSSTLDEVGVGAFRNCSKLTAIDLPNSLKTICNNAFAYSGLNNITIPANVTFIETNAFGSCNSLTDITVSESNQNYKSVDGVLFNKTCTDLLEYPLGKTSPSYIVPDGVTAIGPSAFSSSTYLEEVILPNSLNWILNSAFFDCRELSKINIPSLVTSIGDNAFWCVSITSLVLPDSVISIGDHCFQDCNYLTGITLSNNLTHIGEKAFANSRGITSISIPANVEEIGDRAFSNCYHLTDITVEEGNQYYKSIDGALFDYNVTNLVQCLNDPGRSSYEIPMGVITISDGAFAHCVYLNNITIPNTVKTIVNGAFERCNVETINIPASVTSMADRTFEHCTELQYIDVDNSNPYYSSINGVLFNKNGTRLLQYTSGSEETSYTVPDGVTNIISSAFQFNILETVTLPASLSNIEGNALNECTNLKEIVVVDSNLHYSSNGGVLFDKTGTILYQYPRGNENPNYIIPNGVTNLEYHSFYRISNLKNVYIPASVNSISSSAFSDFFDSYLGVIYGESGSYAESYANSMDINFIAGEIVLVSGVELDKETLFLYPGETVTLTATVYPENATLKDVTWEPSHSNIASISNGVVNAYRSGTITATVTTKDGGFTDTCTITVKSVQIESSVYTADQTNGLLKNVSINTSVAQLKANLTNDASDIKVYDKDGNEYTGDLIATGMTVKLIINNVVSDELTIVVLGDVSGDGLIDITDILYIRADIINTYTMKEYQISAADINKDGEIDITDILYVRAHIIGTYNIHA